MKLSQVRKSFTCQGHFLHLPHTAALEVNSHSAQGIRHKHFDYGSADVIHQSRGGRPLHQRKRHLTETHPPSGPLGSLTFPGQGKQTSFRKELCSQCGKEEEGKLEKVKNVFTLGREPTTREVSVLSEKVSNSSCPVGQQQIQVTARTQRTLTQQSHRA